MLENYDPKRFDGVWISDTKFAFHSQDHNIKLFDCQSMNQTTIMSNSTIVIDLKIII